MKLVIASDIHGSAAAAHQLAERIEEFRPDCLVFLGDLLYHGPRNDLPTEYDTKAVYELIGALPYPKTAVRGNCDAEVDQWMFDFDILADYQRIEVDGRVFAMTHGHLYGQGVLPPGCEDAAVLMNGHTHVKVLERKDGLVLLNPGSTSIPKDGLASYATYDNGVFALRALADGEVVKELAM